MSFHQLVSS